jgi:tetratricopeptide (TPR) repeat protein
MLCGLLIWLLHKSPIGIFYASWFAVMLAPAILYRDTLQEHDRYFYFASIATSIGFAYLIAQIRRLGAVPLTLSVCTLFGLMAASTFHYESYWDNDVKLFTRAAEIAPSNPNVVDYLVSVYISQNNFAKAESVAQTLMDDPQLRAQGWYTLANVRSAENRFPEARTAMQTAVELTHGNHLLPNVGLAAIDLRLGDNAEAAAIYQKELVIYPKIASLHGDLATALTRMGRTDEAKQELKIKKGLE